MYKDSIVAWFLIIFGAILFIFAAGDFILRLILALCALILINHGLRLRGSAAIQNVIRRSFDEFWS